jgi:exodeoxyribonuclease V alpha subunit
VGTLTISDNKELVVNYQSGIKQTVNYEQLHDEFQLAYCMTVHKVQGSQYENVVIIIHPEHEFSWTNNESKQLLYTAVSRAKKRCFILGSKTLFMKAQHENHTSTSTDKSVMMKQFTNYTVS